MQDLKVYGVPSAKYDHLIQQLNQTIEKKNLRLKIREVYDLSILIKDGVEKIPTIRLKNYMDLILEDQMEFDDFIKLAQDKLDIIPEELLKPKILVPTDFSKQSQQAYEYAKMIADQLDARIELIHVYHPEAISIGGGQVAINYSMEDAQAKMDLLVGSNNDEINGRIIQGFASTEIVKLSSTYDFIIMSSSGEGNELQKWFGTTASAISARSECPVIFVPRDYKAKPPKKAIYTVGKGVKYFDHITCLLKSMKTDIQFLHVHTDHAENVASGFAEIESLKSQFPEIGMTINSVHADTVTKGINEALLMESPDLLIMEKSNPTFFEKMLSKSQTKKAIETLNIPVVVLHHKDKMCKCGGLCKKAPKDRCNH